MKCDLCHKTPEIAEGIVTVTISDFTQTYCGTPSVDDEMSCWQRAIRGWYWALMSPQDRMALQNYHQDNQPAPSMRALEEPTRGRTREPRLAVARGELIVH